MIQVVSHITFIVEDLDKTTRFLENVFEAEMIYDSGDKQFSLSE